MSLSIFNKYNSQYVKGASLISFRTTRLQIDNKTLELSMVKTLDNYVLFFSKTGVLLKSNHINKYRSYQFVYGYNKNKVIEKIIKLDFGTNLLRSLCEFEYYKNGKILSELTRSFFYSQDTDDVSYNVYSYKDNKCEVLTTYDSDFEEDSYQYKVYQTYDNKNNLIEEKTIDEITNEIIEWNKMEYNSKGEILKEISLNKNGKTTGVYKFMPFEKGLMKGYKYSSEKNNYIHEYLYVYNEKGHWTQKTMIADGEPRYFYDRKIDYF